MTDDLLSDDDDDFYGPDEGEFGITDVLPFADAVQPPFEIGDIVMIIPHRGCDIGAEWCRIPVRITMIERSPVDDAVCWDIDVSNHRGTCPYLIIYCIEHPAHYTIAPVQLIRDQII